MKREQAATAENLLEKLGGAIAGRRAAIVPHNNPDPDAIAASFALAFLMKEYFSVSASIFYSGVIGRAENRAFVSELRIPLKKRQELDLRKFRTIAVVDTQPGAGNLFLPPRLVPTIVLDRKRDAARVVRRLVGRHGAAGGHGMIAGGGIPIEHPSPSAEKDREVHRDVELLKSRFLKELKKREDIPPVRIVAQGAKPALSGGKTINNRE